MLLIFDVIFAVKFSIAHQCYFYNNTSCAGSVEDCSTVEQCKETSLSEASKCYVLWKNNSNGTFTVQLKVSFFDLYYSILVLQLQILKYPNACVHRDVSSILEMIALSSENVFPKVTR